MAELELTPKPSGHSLPEVLFTLAWLGIWMAQALPVWTQFGQRGSVSQARAAFETDWRAARWQAQKQGRTLRLQAITPCPRPGLPVGWHCGWQLAFDDTGRVLQESRLNPGLIVTVKPNEPWRLDSWGEPLSGGASILFQAVGASASAPELLCMNVLGRLRQVRSDSCSE